MMQFLKTRKKSFASVLGACLLIGAAGCVQYPTERTSVSDMRPQLSFRIDGSSTRLLDARVFIDGLDSGRVGDFIDGRSALRVLPGTHVIRVVSGSEVLLDERFYVGDGVSRYFTVK
jgi:hypothetical protein